MKRILVAGLVSLCALEASAWGNGCKYQREVEREAGVNNLDMLKVTAGAGALAVVGERRDNIAIKARLCAGKEAVLAKMGVEFKLEADAANISTVFPDQNWLSGGRGSAYIDLELQVPSQLNLNIRDSSGEASVRGVASLDMVDSSGQLEIVDIDGAVSVVDSSGQLSIEEVGGDVRVTDSSGGIRIRNIAGGLVIDADSSGGISVERVAKSVLVKRDTSGEIEVDNIVGDFTVLADTSGGVDYSNVGGKVSLPN